LGKDLLPDFVLLRDGDVEPSMVEDMSLRIARSCGSDGPSQVAKKFNQSKETKKRIEIMRTQRRSGVCQLSMEFTCGQGA
jgi:hypothetical protein